MVTDEPPYKHARRRAGEDRKNMLRILYDAETAWSITDLEEESGASRGSRDQNIRWLRGELGNGEWWPDDLGSLIRMTKETGPRGTRYFEITEDGEKFVDALRDARDIKTDADYSTLRGRVDTYRDQIEGVPDQVEDNEERIKNLRDSVDDLEERVKELEGINEKLDTLREEIADVNEKLD